MVYGILRMINFAHGDIFMGGAFAGYFTAMALVSTGFLNASVIASLISIVVMILVAMAVSTALAHGRRARRLPAPAQRPPAGAR